MTRNLVELDRDLEAARVVDCIERDVALALAPTSQVPEIFDEFARRDRGRRRQARAGWLKTLGLVAAAALGALLTWAAHRRAR